MIVNHARRFVFYHVPKAAGTSVAAAMLHVPGSEKFGGTKHLTPAQYRSRLGWFDRLRLTRYWTFCFVRNPWDRFGSLHRYLLSIELGRANGCPSDVNDLALLLEDRAEWVMNLHSIRPQVAYADHVDFVGRYETIEQDFASVCQRLGLDSISLKHKNSSGGRVNYTSCFTPRTIDIIAGTYRDDIDRFGYAFA
jgi:hypothetical protein